MNRIVCAYFPNIPNLTGRAQIEIPYVKKVHDLQKYYLNTHGS